MWVRCESGVFNGDSLVHREKRHVFHLSFKSTVYCLLVRANESTIKSTLAITIAMSTITRTDCYSGAGTTEIAAIALVLFLLTVRAISLLLVPWRLYCDPFDSSRTSEA